MADIKNEQLKPFLRVLNTDLQGEKPIALALRKVNGVSFSLAHAICRKLNMNPKKQAGLHTDVEVKKIEQVIKARELPSWMYNRRGDFDTGEDMHLTGSDLKLNQEFDVKRMKMIKSYKGIRHAIAQPVRGQRTRSHFRHGRSVGVQKTKMGKVAAAAKAPDGKDKK